jgi:hypothetical protein
VISADGLAFCIDAFAKLANRLPRNVLPPSRGMMLTRTPPSASSAETADVSTVSSCSAAVFGTAPAMDESAISVPSEMPFCVMRCELPLLPCTVS